MMRNGFQLIQHARRVGGQIAQIVGAHGVLILRVAGPASHAHILHGLQKEGGSGHARQLRPQALDDLVGADLAFIQRLQRNEHPRRIGGGAASSAREGVHGVDGRILRR